MMVTDFLAKLNRVTGTGPWKACCPAHDDRDPSLGIDEGDMGGIVVRCYAGCTAEAIVAAMGLTLADLMPENGHRQSTIVATYDYKDEGGTLLYQVVRYAAPKDFKQRRPDGNGGWIWNLKGTRRVLYRLPELLAADPEATVLVAEGEKDVDRLRSFGYVATCNAGGAGKWRPEYGEPLRSRRIIVIPDADDTGRLHAHAVKTAVADVAGFVGVMPLPDGCKDVSDFFDNGGTTDQLDSLTAEDPKPEPAAMPAPDEGRRLIVTWEQFMAETYPPVPSLWGDALLVKTGGYLLLAGDTGVGKTILKANLILSLAEGRDEFLGFPLPGRPVTSLLLEAEGARQLFRDRFRRIAEARGVYGSLPVAFHERNVELAIDGPNLATMIEQAAAEYVCLDAIGRFWSGNENDATEWRAGVTAPLAKLTAALGIAISFNDHPSKPNENRTGHHTIKGSGAKVHDCGATLRLEVGKGGGRSRILFFDRVRDGALPFPDRDPCRLPLLIDVAAGTIAVDEAADAEGRLDTAREARYADVRKAVDEVNDNLGLPPESEVSAAMLHLRVQTITGLGKSQAKDLVSGAVSANVIERSRHGHYRRPGALGDVS